MPRTTRPRTRWSAAMAAAVLAGLGLAATPAWAAVPTPAAGESVVTVRVGGDRTGTRTVAPLAGTQLGLYAAAGDTEAVDPSWGVCTSDADGDCSFTVPDTQDGGANAGAQFVVQQISAPAGWYTNPTLRTGNGSGSVSTARPYTFTTPALVAGQTYSSQSDFMAQPAVSGSSEDASEGVWQQSRTNPPFQAACGIDIAFVLDLSSSLGSQVTNLKAATNTIADSLVGTPSRAAVFSFDANSPSTGTQNYPELVSVATAQSAAQFKAQYANWSTGSGTNWDRGLWSVAQADPTYELVVMITDGNPTRYSASPNLGTGGTTHFADVENGIYSANAIKAEGSRLVVMGVGSGVDDVTRLNLRALSGETFYTGGPNPELADYFDVDNFEAAGQTLRNLVLSNCVPRVNVTKLIVPTENTGDDVTGAQVAGAGWQFDAEIADPDVTLDASSKTTEDDGTGSVAFTATYQGTPADTVMELTETQQPGYTLVSPGGAHASCVDKLDDDAPVPVTNTGETAFSVGLPEAGFINCLVYNKVLSSVQVEKTWVIQGQTYAEGDQPADYSAQLTLTGPGGAAASNQDWGAIREGYDGAEDVVVDEQVDLPEGCRLIDARVTAVDGAAADAPLPATVTAGDPRTVQVVNRVECEPFLTLVKQVINDAGGTATARDWTLSATGPTPGISGVTDAPEVTLAPVDPGTYTLAESGPAGYTAQGWVCVDRNDGSELAVDGDTVTIGDRGDVVCTVTNDDIAAAPAPVPDPGDAGRRSGGLPVTGAQVGGAAALATLLLATGALLILGRRHWRRPGSQD
ncbi:hypothetical protein [Cellulomonas sp. NPDC089187]|uniref:prealbumin-like fold domain-containing protein n=1 Tax=Cellulomonas sp. NPDC089187 TaxID=3154970 RepID=UPI003437FB7D